MKSKSRFLFVASLAISAASSAFAGTYYWDTDDTNPGFGTAGGTWGSSAFWNTDSTGGNGGTLSSIATTTSDDIFFGTDSLGLAAGTVTGPGTAQGFRNMTFGSASGAIILSGGFLNLDATTGSTVTVNNTSDTISTVLQGSGGKLVKEGSGTLNLNGYHTYTGGTTVNAGTLVLGSGGSTGAIRGTLNININAIVKLNAGDALGYGNITDPTVTVTQINIVGGTLDNAVNANNGYFASWSLTGGNMTSTGGGTFHILGSKTITSLASATQSTISGKVAIRGANSDLAIDVADGDAATDLLMSGIISNSPYEAGANRITKNGAGTLTLSGASTYSGGTTLNNGTLLLGVSTTGTITNGPVGTGTLTLAGGTLGFSANGLGIHNAINVTGTTTIGQAASNSATLSGAITGNGTLRNYNGGTSNSNNFFFTGNLGGFTGTIEYTGSSTATTAWWRVGATGGTTVNLSGATLNLIAGTGSSKNFGFLDGTSVANTLRLSRLTGGGVFQGSFLGSSSIFNVIEVGNGDASSTFSGVIGVSGANMDRISLNKVGTGTLTLSGANIHTGGTTVTAGTLVVNNTTGSGTGTGAVAVNSSATLKGTGTIGGATTFAADPDGVGTQTGGIHSPGNSTGTQKFTNNVTYSDGSIFEWEIDRAATQTRGTGYDAVNVTGTLAGLDGGDDGTTTDAIFRIVITDSNFSNAFWSTNKSWTDIFTESNGTTAKSNWASIFGGGFQYFYNNGTTLTSISAPDAGTIGSFSFTGGNTLTWTAVPEPTSALAGLLIAAGLLRRRR